jgi:hypothetical protein
MRASLLQAMAPSARPARWLTPLPCPHPTPRLPVARVAINTSPLQLTLSPWRYQRLLMVVRSLAPPPDAAAPDAAAPADADAAASDAPLWQSEAEYKSRVAVLSWEGIGAAVAKWHQQRWLYVWRGRLYVTAREDDREPLVSKAYWKGYRVVYLPSTVRGPGAGGSGGGAAGRGALALLRPAERRAGPRGPERQLAAAVAHSADEVSAPAYPTETPAPRPSPARSTCSRSCRPA